MLPASGNKNSANTIAQRSRAEKQERRPGRKRPEAQLITLVAQMTLSAAHCSIPAALISTHYCYYYCIIVIVFFDRSSTHSSSNSSFGLLTIESKWRIPTETWAALL